MSVKFLLLGGGLGGGGECRFYFYGRADFSEPKVGATFGCTFHVYVCVCVPVCVCVLPLLP